MKRMQKKIIQSAAIRIGIGVLTILIGYFFLGDAEVYQKACYAFGYLFVSYTLVVEVLSDLSKRMVLTMILLASVVFGIMEYYKTAIVIMLANILLDAILKFANVKKWNPYPLYIFDLDGTIVDTLESLAYTTNLVLKEFNLQPQPTDAYRKFVGDGARKLMERALIAADDVLGDNGIPVHLEEALESYFSKFEEHCTYRVAAYGGMRDTLETLKETGVKLAVFTNKRHAYALNVVKAVYGEDFFDAVLGEGNGFPRKPNPEGALYLAEQFGVAPNDCVYVGDSDVDMHTGLAAGMQTIGVTWGFRTKSELQRLKPTAVIHSPEKILELSRPN